MKAYILAEGNVQGVGYRAHVLRSARLLGVRGFARNLPDGRVEVYVIARDERHLGDFLREIEKKSTSFYGIHVERLRVSRQGQEGFVDFGEFSSFEVSRF